MKEFDFAGKTVQEAIENGLKELGLAREDVEVKVLSEGKTGLFGLMGASPAKVKLFTGKAVAGQAAKKRDESPLKTATASPELDKKAETELKKILKYMKIDATVEAQRKDDHLYLDIVTRDSALLIGKHGSTLNSLQLLLNMMVKHSPEERVNVILDTSGYRVRRERLIEKLALEAAKDAVDTGIGVALEPMNSSERRIVHVLLKENPDVVTSSDGDGISRRVVISPKKH